MRASPLAPAPLARTLGLPASPDTVRRVMPGALRQEHPPATSEEVQTDSVRVRAPQIHFTSPHRTHFMPNHSAKCMMTIAERPGSAQHPADTARAAAMTTSQPPPPSSHDIGQAFSRTTRDRGRFTQGRAQRQRRRQSQVQSPQVSQRAETQSRGTDARSSDSRSLRIASPCLSFCDPQNLPRSQTGHVPYSY